jgi:hypothetical protein
MEASSDQKWSFAYRRRAQGTVMMRRGTEKEREASVETPGGLRVETRALTDALAAIGGVNKQLLEALRLSAGRHEFPLVQSLRAPFAALTAEHIHQAPSCGVLLADAGFTDVERWRRLSEPSELAPSVDPAPDWLGREHAIVLSYAILMVAWHVVHTAPAAAGVLLGMSQPVLAFFRQLDTADLARIARHHSGLIRPRWVDRPDLWRSMVESDCDTDTETGPLGSLSMILSCLLAGPTGLPPLTTMLEAGRPT